MINNDDYVIINDRAYDPVTGLPLDNVPVEKLKPAVEPADTPVSKSLRGVTTPVVHRSSQQHSATLSRRYVKKPSYIAPQATVAAPVAQPIAARNYSPVNLNQLTTEKAKAVQKFTTQSSASRPDRPAETHPMARRASGRSLDIASPQRRRLATQQKLDTQAKIANHQTANQTSTNLKPAHVLKNEAIAEAMAKEVAPQRRQRTKKQHKTGRWSKFLTFATSSLAVIALAGYFTYLNMPNISIKMAAVQSGINAKYPGYQPDGYALNGPITFKDGEVSMRFAYSGGERKFDIKQQRSSWDSSAVKQFVDEQSSDSMATTVNGLTIYTYGSSATWVDSGVLYTIQGDAPLSSDQIQKIATSM